MARLSARLDSGNAGPPLGTKAAALAGLFRGRPMRIFGKSRNSLSPTLLGDWVPLAKPKASRSLRERSNPPKMVRRLLLVTRTRGRPAVRNMKRLFSAGRGEAAFDEATLTSQFVRGFCALARNNQVKSPDALLKTRTIDPQGVLDVSEPGFFTTVGDQTIPESLQNIDRIAAFIRSNITCSTGPQSCR